MKGLIHSFESFGTKDGPGIRFVIFMQGCPLRCLYCHNPDTWKMTDYKYEKTPEEVFADIEKVKEFVRGGVTVSGGEPLLQSEFVLELFKLCKAKGIHTAVDTSGYLFSDSIKEVLEYTDLVLLDIKHIVADKYKALTKKEIYPTLKFMDYLSSIKKAVWVRYVLVPGYSDNEQDLHEWAKYVSGFDNVERVDILPFHQMGKHKWDELGEQYELTDTPSPSKETVEKAQQIFLQYKLPVV